MEKLASDEFDIELGNLMILRMSYSMFILMMSMAKM